MHYLPVRASPEQRRSPCLGGGHLPRQQPGPWGALASPQPCVPVPKPHCSPRAGGFVLPLAGTGSPPAAGDSETFKETPRKAFSAASILPSIARRVSGMVARSVGANGCSMQSRPHGQAPRPPRGTHGTLPAAAPGRRRATGSSRAPRAPRQHPTPALGRRDLCHPQLFGAAESSHLGRGAAPNLLSPGNTSTNAAFRVLFKILKNSDQVTTSQNKSCDSVVRAGPADIICVTAVVRFVKRN